MSAGIETDINKKTGLNRVKAKNRIIPWLFVLPGILFTFIFRYYTMFQSFWISLHHYDIAKSPGKFIGFANYTGLLKNPDFWNAWENTLAFAALILLLTFLVPLIQAIFLSEVTKGRGIFSTLYLVPAVIPLSVTVIIWKWIFNPNYGLANYILKVVGVSAKTWYSDPDLVKISIVIPMMIGGGFGVLLYLSAIQGISGDIVEAAQIDGCTGFKKLFYITLPNISFLIFIQLILSVIGALQILDPVIQFSRGGPNGASTSIAFSIYDFIGGNQHVPVYGRATAAAFMLLIFITLLTVLQMRLDKSEKD